MTLFSFTGSRESASANFHSFNKTGFAAYVIYMGGGGEIKAKMR